MIISKKAFMVDNKDDHYNDNNTNIDIVYICIIIHQHKNHHYWGFAGCQAPACTASSTPPHHPIWQTLIPVLQRKKLSLTVLVTCPWLPKVMTEMYFTLRVVYFYKLTCFCKISLSPGHPSLHMLVVTNPVNVEQCQKLTTALQDRERTG